MNKLMMRLLIVFISVSSSISFATSNTNAWWIDMPKNQEDSEVLDMDLKLRRFRAFKGENNQLQSLLQEAPEEQLEMAMEDTQASIEGLLLELPLPDGGTVRFRMFRSSIMEPELAQKFPEIQTYWGYDESNPKNQGRFDFTPAGFHGMFNYNGKTVYIDPTSINANDIYASYWKRDAISRGTRTEQVIDVSHVGDVGEDAITGPQRLNSRVRTYRLAVATSAEYTEVFGGTVEGGMAQVATAINRINQVYLTDLAIRLQLVARNELLIYTDAATDPYENSAFEDSYINTANLNRVIGSANYDMGHLFIIDNTSVVDGGGSVCGSNKGNGVSGKLIPRGDPFFIDYVAHEMGHQFNANHTFNTREGSCNQRIASNAYEPGSGSTIMGYSGTTCGEEDLQSQSDPYFHSRSISEINTFITTGSGSTCGTLARATNNSPTADAGPDRTLPARTPFYLNGRGTDGDLNDWRNLTYTWEEDDLGAASRSRATMVDDGSRPIVRSIKPRRVTQGTAAQRGFGRRNIPRISDIIEGQTRLGTVLPTTSRNMDFRLTVRDGKGGIGIDDAQMTIVDTGSAFRVTSPVADTVWRIGQANRLTWDVAETNIAPINCPNVGVHISTDNGRNFKRVRGGVTNDGDAMLTLPNSVTTATSDARIYLGCGNNRFFNISKKFSIALGGTPPLPSGNSNLALNKTARQSSTGFGGVASRAIDGNTRGAWSGNSVTHTNRQAQAWWRVDLGSVRTIGEIKIYNRTDCCGNRLANYTVSVLDASQNQVWANRQTSAPNPSKTVNAGGVRGRYVRVQLTGTGVLSLAEVQVFAGK